VLGFAASCAAASLYAALIHSWPFAAVESVWVVVALRRWARLRPHPAVAPLASAALLLAAPPLVQAQPAVKMHRVGIVSPIAASPEPPQVRAFRQEMRELGYIEGKTVAFETRFAEGRPERLPTIPRSLRPRADRVIE
jgi:hypothetical protein